MQTAVIIFTITFLGIIFTRLPFVNIDRPSAAFFGAVAMVLFGILSPAEALESIDFNTIALLLGMMIIIAVMQLDGFFNWLASKTMGFAGNQRRLLTIIIFVTGIASAFMVNDVVVLMFTPVVIAICRQSGLNPVPFLMGVIFSANIGSAMTITGNPQNMLIGISSGISYARFLLLIAPISILGMLVIIPVIRLMYKKDFQIKKPVISNPHTFGFKLRKMRWSIPVFSMVILLFFIGKPLGLSIPVIALAGASLILLVGRIKPSHVIKKVDWVLLLFFAGLFVVVKGFENSGALENLLSIFPLNNNAGGMLAVHGISFVASQIVSNVPFTVAFLPFMHEANSEMLWIALASASTLAGNATIIGAVANIIVIESAAKHDVKIRFFEFLKPGIVVTLLSLLISCIIIVLWMHAAAF
ncbi:MAG: anion transporter [Bacteroidales bacterium]|jgi:Na+/H+ antiporter NhaD/arsenite permease-like protein|nr:anion transporter [Bacteroidales bacterium]